MPEPERVDLLIRVRAAGTRPSSRGGAVRPRLKRVSNSRFTLEQVNLERSDGVSQPEFRERIGQIGLLRCAQRESAASGCPIDFQQTAQFEFLPEGRAQQVHALISPDGSETLHATWSASAFLAHLYQSGLLGEMSASVVRNAIKAGMSPAEIARHLKRLDKFEHTDTPAFAMLSSPPLRPARPRSRAERGDSTAVRVIFTPAWSSSASFLL